jgi:Family of unknown function (DUF5677)
MTAHQYSDASQAGRDLAEILLDGSSYVDGLEVEVAARERWVPALFVMRVRRLVRGALLLADDGQGLEAAILLRSVSEYLITFHWLFLDFDAHDLVWRIDDLRSIVAMDDAASKAGFGILDAQIREKYLEARARWRERLDALDNIDARVPEKARDRLPGFEQRANAAQLEGLYGLAYRWDSLAAAHPNATAVEQFLERPGGGIFRIAAETQHPLPDPYPIAALLLMLVLLKAGEVSEELRYPGDLDAVAGQLREMGAQDAMDQGPIATEPIE